LGVPVHGDLDQPASAGKITGAAIDPVHRLAEPLGDALTTDRGQRAVRIRERLQELGDRQGALVEIWMEGDPVRHQRPREEPRGVQRLWSEIVGGGLGAQRTYLSWMCGVPVPIFVL